MSRESYKKRKRKRAEARTSLRSLSRMKSNKGRKTLGFCNVCGKRRLLEFDHVIPKSTINLIQKNNKWLQYKDVLLKNWDDSDTVVQKLGFTTVCRKCNGISSEYISEFNNMTLQLLNHIIREVDNHTITLKINPLFVFKQILYMFLVQNSGFKNRKYHTYLYQLISDKYAITNNFDSLFKIYVGLYTGSDLAYHPYEVDNDSFRVTKQITATPQHRYKLKVDDSKIALAIELGIVDNMIVCPPFFYRLIRTHELTKDIDVSRMLDVTIFSTIPSQTADVSITADVSVTAEMKNINPTANSFVSSLMNVKDLGVTTDIPSLKAR